MFDLRFRICRKGSWTHHLSKKYKGTFTSHITFSLGKNKTSDILHVEQKNDKDFSKILSYIRKHPIVYKVDEMFRDETHMYLQIYSNVGGIKSLIGTVNKFNGFIVNPIPLVEGDEVWTVTTPSKERLPELIEAIKECGDFTLVSIKPSSIDNSNLSPMQKKVFFLAKNLGYYNFPRNISAQDMAKRLKISKATLLQHLRTAEAKVLNP